MPFVSEVAGLRDLGPSRKLIRLRVAFPQCMGPQVRACARRSGPVPAEPLVRRALDVRYCDGKCIRALVGAIQPPYARAAVAADLQRRAAGPFGRLEASWLRL